MKKIVLFSFLLLSAQLIWAQTGGENNSGQTPPSYQNPFGTNPYGTNPYGGSQNKNIFKGQNEDNKNNQGDNNTNPTNNQDNDNGNTRDSQKQNLDFRDRNQGNQGRTDEELREMYKNDPDYLKYLSNDNNINNSDSIPIEDDTTDIAEEEIYGANFLSSGSNFDTGNLTTVPESYRLGVGDEVVVSVWGSAEFQSPFTISKDGAIFPNRVGKIFLQGLSFQAARSVIRSRFKRVLPGGSHVDIGLGKVRTIRVFVYDQVKRPGMITMSALNTPINALQRAGGLTKYGNLRDIQIRRNGMVIDRIDIYEYLKNGNSGREFYMEDNDVITVGLYDKVVEASGAFKRPMKYQMTSYGTLSDLIELAGGARFDARKSLIRIKTIYNEKEQYIEINGKDFLADGDYLLKDGDVITINPINEGVSNVVTISGAVPYPDQYQVREDDRIFYLIQKAGGLSADAYKSRAYIYRNGNTSDKSVAIKIDLNEYGNPESAQNVLLQSGDAIQILSEEQFDERFTIKVQGLVRNPGDIKYKSNMRLKDALIISGGLELEAESGRIEISNVTDSVNRYSITGNNVNVKVISINPDLTLDDISESIILKPFDIIFVRKKKKLIEQKLIDIVGEVDYPGTYALLGEDERITSLLIRSGGLRKDAFPEAAKLIRENYGPVVINLKDAMRNAGGKDDIVLEEGDQIIIPKQDEIVRVAGNVQKPINIKFDSDKRSVMDYIDAAGGFGEKPWRSRISIRYQNGQLKRTKNFLFLKFYPRVKPGSLVNVPVRPKTDFDLNKSLQYILTTASSAITIIFLARSVNSN